MRKLISGFTLVEILIVMLIISIVTSVALITISHNDKRRIQMFANQLVQSITLAEEQAMLQPEVLGLSLNHSSYSFASYQASTIHKNNTWVPLQDNLLGKHFIPDGLALTLVPANEQKNKDKEINKNLPQVIISTNGDLTPFKMYVGEKGKAPRYLIEGDADGSISSKELS